LFTLRENMCGQLEKLRSYQDSGNSSSRRSSVAMCSKLQKVSIISLSFARFQICYKLMFIECFMLTGQQKIAKNENEHVLWAYCWCLLRGK
jgi:hypothetical protein